MGAILKKAYEKQYYFYNVQYKKFLIRKARKDFQFNTLIMGAIESRRVPEQRE